VGDKERLIQLRIEVDDLLERVARLEVNDGDALARLLATQKASRERTRREAAADALWLGFQRDRME
jgi:hypothetical protein